MTDAELSNLCARIYAVDASTDKFWAHYWCQDDVVCGHVVINGTDCLIFRGSITFDDWLRDFDAVPQWTDKLGFVHMGFYKGIPEIYQTILSVVGNNVAISGHSLGAAHACLIAGLFTADSINIPCSVQNLVTFGQPKPGFSKLREIIESSGMRHVSYRNRKDPVPLVPLFPFENTENWIPLDVMPDGGDEIPSKDHSISLYVQGVSALPA